MVGAGSQDIDARLWKILKVTISVLYFILFLFIYLFFNFYFNFFFNSIPSLETERGKRQSVQFSLRTIALVKFLL